VSLEIDVKLLGPLEVSASGESVQFEGAKQRALFTLLALRAPEAVPADELVEALWGGHPPAGATQALQKQISRLRHRLGGTSELRHRPAGYALEIDPQGVDTRRFEALLERARIEFRKADSARGTADLRAALALWRGAALADHRADDFALRDIVRLEELRAEAIEERLAADLASGHDADLIGEIQALVAEHPLRERLRAHLMVALYRAGRQAEALEAMREGRALLVDELGIEPGPELRRLERMILAHDPDLTAELPPAALAAPLPAPPNATIGRRGELAEVTALMVRPEVRLITLVGPGGVGKTRLAVNAAWAVEDRFPGGVVHVNLDGVEDAGMLATEAASALGVAAATAQELGERLGRATRGAPALLILDGVERFLDDAEQVGHLLAAARNLTVLATSRAALRLTAEHAYPVFPLAPPNAAALFAARATAARPDRPIGEDEHEIVDAICARLDGLPLAIELAADRVRLLSLPALFARLERRLELLTGGPRDLPARQRSLRATLEWSWDVLDDPERVLLGRLTVFEGASLEAAEAICNGDADLGAGVEALVSSLMDKTSLLRTDAGLDDQPRFRLLGTISEFAAERAGDLAELELRHARYFLSYCEHAVEEAPPAHRREWLDRLAQERGNVRLAYECFMREDMADDALRVAIAFARALPWDAHTHEVRGWLAQALVALPADPTVRQAIALYWDGRLAISQARFEEARSQLEAARAAARVLGERDVEAAALAALGRRAVLVGSPEAMALCEAAVVRARSAGDPILAADAILFMAGACERARAWERAEVLAAEALELYRAAGDSYGVVTALAELGWYDLVQRRPERAEERLAEALELRRRHGNDRRLVEPLIDHAWLTLMRRGGEDARARFVDCLALARDMDDPFIVGEALAGLSAQAALDGRWAHAARLAGASAAVHERIGAPPWESVTLMQERALGLAREALGAGPFAALFREGRELSSEDAVAWPADEAGQRDVRGASADRGRVADIA
jgi:predicted ATPase/DNA-binding SARP family transcriptional activator